MLGPLVVGREARGVGRLGHLALEDLLEGVDALAGAVDVAHQMHLDWIMYKRSVKEVLMGGVRNGVVVVVVVG